MFASFAFFGLVAAVIDFFIYVSLLRVDSDPIFGNLISSSVGILLNYFLVSNYTFGMDFKSSRNLILFFVIAVGVLIFSSLFLSFLISALAFNPLIAKFVTLPLSAVIKYVINRKYTFI
jgi:putative flippase GtrA